MLRATLVYVFVGLYILGTAPIGLIWTHIAGDTSLLYVLARACIRISGWMAGIRVMVRGREHLQSDQAYLFLSNHQANLDGPILCHATQRNCRAVIKKEMLRIPVLSWVLKTVQFVPIDRRNPVQAHESIDQAARLLEDGYSFFAFPEGTRSRDGSLGGFKKGVFVMAIKAGVPVVPVSISNSRALQPPGRYRIQPGLATVIFHPPIPTRDLLLEDRDRLLEQTRAAIESGLRTAGGNFNGSSCL